MQRRQLLIMLTPLFVVYLAGLVACSDESGPAPDRGMDQSVDLINVDLPTVDGQVDSVETSDMGAADIVSGDIAAGVCTPLGANECFSNLECIADRRCEEVDIGEGELFPCCVVATRGTLEAGETCSDENQCASAICISAGSADGRCSQTCTEATDCPEGMQDCKLIAFSNSDDRWCFPEVL
ncbi:MAG: hypothetical protein JRH20_14415 [Deltaproteobacteria bacterium]|nr:hypothetical protein [Deltaproteobacteria bacterium]